MDKGYYRRVSIGPYTNFSKSPAFQLMSFWLAVSPQIVLLFITKSYSSLLVILAAVLGVFCAHWKDLAEKDHPKFYIAYSVFTGTLTGFFIPAGFPPVSVFFITFIFMFCTKTVFGGRGVTWLNPVALIVTAAWFVGHFNFPGFLITHEDLMLKNPSLSLIQNFIGSNPYDEHLTAVLNNSAFSFFNVSIPEGYVSLFWDNLSVIPAFRFSALTLLASIVLIAFNFEGGIIPLVYLSVYSLLVKFVSPFFTGGVPFSGDILLALLSSGTLFTAFFLLQWHGTIPCSKIGKFLYGCGGGLLAFIFCGAGTSPIGSVVTVLFLNLITPMITLYEYRLIKKRASKLLADSEGGEAE